MKVALVIERMDLDRGGRETSTAQIATNLLHRGCEVTILCQSGSWSGNGVPIEALGVKGATRRAQMKNFIADVQRQIASGRFDIVHTMLPVPGANVYQPRGGTIPAQAAAGLRRRGRLGRAGSMLGRSLNLHRRQMARMERKVAADPSSLCLCVSKMVANEFEQYYGRQDNVRVVYNAVDINPGRQSEQPEFRRKLRTQLGVTDDTTVFLCIATNFVLKGVAELFDAFAAWRNRPGRPAGRLVVVGGCRFADRYHRHAAKLGLGQHVTFVPPTQDVFPWYAAADATVLLSWYDPCSRVVLESIRYGIPAVTTAYNGAAEVLAAGSGIVVDTPRNLAAVADALDRLADPAKRAAMSRRCLEQSGELGMDKHVEQLLEAYRTLLG